MKKVATSWMLPKQVSKLDDLEPGTWLIAEVDGSIGASLGIKYGYDFNWVHEAKLMGLSGDIGLKLKLGVEAARVQHREQFRISCRQRIFGSQ